jgi:tetratricopeptide (TPR) repeat protein
MVAPGSDDYITEKYQDRIAEILATWSSELLQSPTSVDSLRRVLTTDFSGPSLLASNSKLIRPAASLIVYQDIFPEANHPPTPFLENLQSYLATYTHLQTAEFQITAITGTPQQLRTQVRFELVGAGPGFHREQRSGYWDLEWRDYRLHAWHATSQTRSRSLAPCYADISQQAFSHAPSFNHQLNRGVDYWRTVIDGASGIDIYGHNGISVGDIDNDGFDDLYVCQPAGLPNRLFRNRGDGTFEDITEQSGIGLLDNTACALFADFNNDGLQDLVIVRAEGPLLYLNQGSGKFQLKPDAFHFATPPQGTFTGAAAADYNRDGYLDIYFCLYVFYRGTDQYNYPTPYYAAENGPPNFLMRNNGDGTFRDVTSETGLNQNNTRFSFCCGWGDFNGNGWPDLYVVNDFGRKNLYRNNGDGTFTDVAPQAGVEDVGAGMSVSWADYNNDGLQDLYVANMWTAAGERISMQESFAKSAPPQVRALYQKHAMGNSLLRNSSGQKFQDVTAYTGAGMGRWSWSSDAIDFDHSGHSSIYVTNGMLSGPVKTDLNSFFWRQVVANSPDAAKPSSPYERGWSAINELIRADYTWSGYERNVFLANNHDGTFSDVSGAIDLDFLEDGRSFAMADFNHDGRQEIFLKNRNAPQLRLLQNTMADLPSSIAFHLKGAGKSNRDAIGASIRVGSQTKFLQVGSGFLSQHSKDIFFGLGDAKGPITATVRWPSGLEQQFSDLPANHRVYLEESRPLPSRMEPFARLAITDKHSEQAEILPDLIETWLISPVAAPKLPSFPQWRRPILLHFNSKAPPQPAKGFQLVTSDESVGVYNTLYRSLFDRHRDFSGPISFLIDSSGDIVKIYQGPLDIAAVERDVLQIPASREARIKKALPFPGVESTYEFGRNYLSLGSAFFQSAFFAQAQNAFEQALREDPNSAEAQYGIGSSYLRQDNIAEAKTSFKLATKLKASYPDTISNSWNNLGLLATRTGDIATAVDCFQAALRDNPDYAIALLNLGNAYRQQKRWDEARNALNHALSLNPADAEANYSLAMVFAQTDDATKAYEYLQRALKSRPAYPEALNNLGVLYLRTRRRDDAVRTFEECIRAAPDFNQSYLNLARVYVIEGDIPKARGLLSEYLKRNPADGQVRQALEQMP